MRRVMKAARRAPIVAAAHHEGNIQIWDLASGDRLIDFNTVYDGMGRSGINQSGEAIVAANWKSGSNAGVVCYDVRSGKERWDRHDLGQVQHMRFSEHGPWIWFEVEGQPLHCLDAHSGATLTTWPTVRDAYDGPFSPRLFLEGPGGYEIGTREDHVAVSRTEGLSLKDAAFAPLVLVVSEGRIVRGIEVESGREAWRYEALVPGFVSGLSFQDDGFVYGVRCGNENNQWHSFLMRFSKDGVASDICQLESAPPFFGGFGDGVFVTPEGGVVGLQAGAISRRLAITE